MRPGNQKSPPTRRPAPASAPPPLPGSAPPPLPRAKLWHVLVLGAILAVAAGTRLYRLDVPEGYYFDEVYYGYTAKEILDGNREVYDPYAKNPEGLANEWTHPPLGKLIIAGTMAVAGRGELGMRLSSAIFGTLTVGLVYLLTVSLFRAPRAGLLAAFLYSMEGLSFVHSRVAIMDIHLVAFMVLALLLYVRWRTGQGASPLWLLSAGLAAGLALATKWTALYLLAVMGVDFLICWITRLVRRRPHPIPILLAGFAAFFVLPAGVYLASYAHYFHMGYSWDDFIALQKQMWWYHTTLKATHACQSVPWQWLLNTRPVWLHVHYYDDGRIANIYDLGNSVVLYFGLGAMAVLAGSQFGRRRWAEIFLLAVYLAMWLPWAVAPRIMFFYHYLPAVPLLCATGGAELDRWLSLRRWWISASACAILVLAAAWFVFFFPQMTAIPVGRDWADHTYYWLPSWR